MLWIFHLNITNKDYLLLYNLPLSIKLNPLQNNMGLLTEIAKMIGDNRSPITNYEHAILKLNFSWFSGYDLTSPSFIACDITSNTAQSMNNNVYLTISPSYINKHELIN